MNRDGNRGFDLVLTANSPGEVAGWLRPVLAELERRGLSQRWRISVFLPPCPFAAGTEAEVVRQLPGVSMVAGPRAYLRYMLGGRKPPGFTPGRRGLVLFLGGDLLHAWLLSRRLGYPALAYTEGRAWRPRSFRRWLVPYAWAREKAIQRGAPPSSLRVVGNLMLDALHPRLDPAARQALFPAPGSGPKVLFLPGSRPAEMRHLAPFFLRVADLLSRWVAGARFALSVSPFARLEQLQQALTHPLSGLEATTGKLRPCPEAARLDSGNPEGAWGPASGSLSAQPAPSLWEIETAAGTRLLAAQGLQYDLMLQADLAITLPGTNTLELSALGCPMVVVLPLQRPEEIPLEGPAGLLRRIPWLGPAVVRRGVQKMSRRLRFAAWPNRLAQEEVVPELRGEVTADRVAQAACDLWRDLEDPAARKALSRRLRSLAGKPGAAGRVVDELWQLARDQEEADSR